VAASSSLRGRRTDEVIVRTITSILPTLGKEEGAVEIRLCEATEHIAAQLRTREGREARYRTFRR